MKTCGGISPTPPLPSLYLSALNSAHSTPLKVVDALVPFLDTYVDIFSTQRLTGAVNVLPASCVDGC